MIEKSDSLLKDFFRRLPPEDKQHVGLMGGWAVHYLVKGRGFPHMGSRDIDIFFDPKKIALRKVEGILGKMGFHRHSTFRWVKIFHSETEKELHPEESKKHPMHNLSYVYFDIATPSKMRHSMPEPLLKRVFAKEMGFVEVSGIRIMVPSARMLAEMKLKSIPERKDAFKRTKDVADLYAILNSHIELLGHKKFSRKSVKKFRERLPRFRIDGTLAGAVGMLGTSAENVAQVLENL